MVSEMSAVKLEAFSPVPSSVSTILGRRIHVPAVPLAGDLMHYNVQMLRVVGLLWRSKPFAGPIGWAFSRLLAAIIWLILTLHFASELVDIAMNIGNVSAISKNVVVTALTMGSWVRLTYLHIFEEEYFTLIQDVNPRFVDRGLLKNGKANMRGWVIQYRWTYALFFTPGCLVSIYWFFHPLFTPEIIIDELTNSTKVTYDFPCGAWYPFEARRPDIYPFVYAFQCTAILLSGSSFIVTDMVLHSLCMFMCGQFEILKETVKHIWEIAEDQADLRVIDEKAKDGGDVFVQELDSVIAWCVDHHCMLLSMIDRTEELHSLLLVENYVGQLILLSCLAFEATTVVSESAIKIINILSYLVMVVVQLFMLCRNGDRLIDEAREVAEAAYAARWLEKGRAGARLRRSLLLVVARARHRSPRLTAGKIVDVSLVTFCDMLSRAFSYFTVLLQLRNE